MDEIQAQVLPDLDGEPAILVFLSGRSWRAMREAEVVALRDRLDAALTSLYPEQLPLFEVAV